MKEQGYLMIPFMPDLKAIANQNNTALKHVFEGKIKGCFLIDVKVRVMKALGLDNLFKYYDFRWSEERTVTGIGGAAEYDICMALLFYHVYNCIDLW